MTDSTSITYRPFGITHAVIAAIFAMSVVAINALEFFFLAKGNALNPSYYPLFFIMLQNVGIALPNSYYLSKINISATGMSESTAKP